MHGKRLFPYTERKGTKASGSCNVAESDTMKKKRGHDHLTNVLHFFPCSSAEQGGE